jgi:hypothetical protein
MRWHHGLHVQGFYVWKLLLTIWMVRRYDDVLRNRVQRIVRYLLVNRP